ncbi:hypothetical protein BT96DRAFT_610282 [Gymnopus androsaceus JB14]|uniref:Transcription factor domain-containing protein n=1 Tax=Gymnopus androsaceus JB14 TaxID=1447944 RepID=A0A6A4HQI8_9AGAR|nr:hypothetical protein BT96DRAFT_610282 [Gymnopus androsaceus JB14]
MLHLMYYFLRIIINWPRKASSAESLEICVAAAQSCIHLMDAHRKRDYVSFGPQMLGTIAHAATILAIKVWKSKQLNLDIDINAEMEDVLRCMDHLKRFEHRIQIAGRNWDTILNVIYISNLANEYNRAKESLSAKADPHQAIAMESGSDIADTSLTPLSTAILRCKSGSATMIPSFGQPQSWDSTQYPAYDPSLQNPLDAPIQMSDAYISSVLPTFESYVGTPIGSLGNLVPPDIPSSYSAPQAELGNLQQQDWTSIAATSDAMDIKG